MRPWPEDEKLFTDVVLCETACLNRFAGQDEAVEIGRISHDEVVHFEYDASSTRKRRSMSNT